MKESLTSLRLAGASGDVSRYRISLEPGHRIIVVQACLGVLLRLDDDKHTAEDSIPLAQYTSRHWVDHAQFENVSSHVCKAMEHLFNPDKPHFLTWLRLHDIDTEPRHSVLYQFAPWPSERSSASRLYYAALCGLYDLTKHLVVKHLQDVNIRGGYYMTPLVAALAGKHFHVAELLYQHGGIVDPRGFWEKTPLHAISQEGDLEIMKWLLSHGADTVLKSQTGQTALYWAAWGGQVEEAKMLLQHNADPNTQEDEGKTPLHLASELGHTNIARLLLAHGADVTARGKSGSTLLHLVSHRYRSVVARPRCGCERAR